MKKYNHIICVFPNSSLGVGDPKIKELVEILNSGYDIRNVTVVEDTIVYILYKEVL